MRSLLQTRNCANYIRHGRWSHDGSSVADACWIEFQDDSDSEYLEIGLEDSQSLRSDMIAVPAYCAIPEGARSGLPNYVEI